MTLKRNEPKFNLDLSGFEKWKEMANEYLAKISNLNTSDREQCILLSNIASELYSKKAFAAEGTPYYKSLTACIETLSNDINKLINQKRWFEFDCYICNRISYDKDEPQNTCKYCNK